MTVKDKKETGLIFGVFDGLHKGHIYLLEKALGLCTELVIVLALPKTVMQLKGHAPRFPYETRAEALYGFDSRIQVTPSDKNPGDWYIFKKLNIDWKTSIVILGYDQSDIAMELKKMKIPYTVLPAHHPEKYKSSLLNPNRLGGQKN